MFISGAGGPRTVGGGRRRRRTRSPLPWAAMLAAIAVVAIGVGAVVVVRGRQASNERQRDAAAAFVAAWVKGDEATMWRNTAGEDRPSQDEFEASYAQARRAAGVRAVRAGRLSPLEDGRVRVPVTVRTRDFGTLYGFVNLTTADVDGHGGVDWDPSMRLPGLRKGEEVRRRSGKRPKRGDVLAAGGNLLAQDPIGAGIAGVPPEDGDPPTGLERIYDDRLAGRPSATLRFGDRVIKRVKARKGRDVHSTVRLGLSRAAQSALGAKLGGVAVIRPRDGAVLALAGLAVSAPQAPGSTFKIITVAGALQEGVAKLSSSYPVRQFATLSGVKLYNASSESCGGSLSVSFAESCNSVFAPMGADLGRKRLVRYAKRFGFNSRPKQIPAAKPSTIAQDLKDDLAVGAAAIGQERDLATPLQMASVGATIANGGVRVRPRLAREERKVKRRVVRKRVARQVRDLMIGVVRGGTGTAAAIPGVTVAGKTGTAELVTTHGGPQDDANTNAWFVAFAPAEDPEVAVAVMLVGGGFGGDSAAPIARQVLQAAL